MRSSAMSPDCIPIEGGPGCPGVGGSAWALLPWGVAGLLAVAVLVLVVLLLRAKGAARLARAEAPAAAAGAAASASASSVFDETLARHLIEIADLAAGAGMPSAADRALAHIGVAASVAQRGEPFDPGSHLIVGTEPATDPALVDRVAATVRPGWAHGSSVLRETEVLLFTASTTKDPA